MMIDDIVDGFQARNQVYILQSQAEVCRAEKDQLFLNIESYERDGILLQEIIDNQIEAKELEALVIKNVVKIEKKKKTKWLLIALSEGAIILLLIIAK